MTAKEALKNHEKEMIPKMLLDTLLLSLEHNMGLLPNDVEFYRYFSEWLSLQITHSNLPRQQIKDMILEYI